MFAVFISNKIMTRLDMEWASAKTLSQLPQIASFMSIAEHSWCEKY